MEEQYFYKVRHKETGLFWKGGGIKNHVKGRIDENAKEDVLKEAFSKLGKSYSKRQHFISALNYQIKYGEEQELLRILLDECEVVQYKTILISSESPRGLVKY